MADAVLAADSVRLAMPVNGTYASTVTPGEWARLVEIAKAVRVGAKPRSTKKR